MSTKRLKQLTGITMLCVFISAGALADGGRHSSPKSSQGVYGGEIRLGFEQKPTLINPILTNHSVSNHVMSLIFDRLFQINAKGELEPNLVREWDVSEDGVVYTFHLRENIQFHDGTPLTAEDVHFTYSMIQDPNNGSPFAASLKDVAHFDILDSHTFQVTLKEVSPAFPYQMIREILPQHLYRDTDLRKNTHNDRPVGSGPFIFKDWGEQNQIILEANPHYPEGRPYLDRLIYRHYESRQEVWSALMRQEIDFMLFLNHEDFEIVRNDPSFQTFVFPSTYYYGIFYNLMDPVLSDLKVRLAIAHAIDRKKLIQRIENGYGEESYGPFAEDSPGFDPEIRPIPYAPKKALAMLSEAGWKDSNDDGVLEKKGKALEIRLLVDSRIDKMHTLTSHLRQDLQSIGIKLIPLHYDGNEILTKSYVEKLGAQAYLRLEIVDKMLPNEALKIWHSEDDRVGKVWSDHPMKKQMDRLIELSRRQQNPVQQSALHRELHRLIYEKQAACFLYYPYSFHAVSKRVGNPEAYFNYYFPDYALKDLYVRKNGHEGR